MANKKVNTNNIASTRNIVKEWKKIKWLSGKELLENSRDCLIVVAASVGILTGYDLLISLVMRLFY